MQPLLGEVAQLDDWGWSAPDDGLEYQLERDANNDTRWKCVNCNVWVEDTHLTCKKHLSWLEWAATHTAARPWVTNSRTAANPSSASSGPPPQPPGQPPPGLLEEPPPPAPAAQKTAMDKMEEMVAAQNTAIKEMQGMVAAQNTAINEMQEEVKMQLQEIEQLRAIVKAKSKTIAEMQETLEAWDQWWWWWSQAEKR